jgi:hypothetical protein
LYTICGKDGTGVLFCQNGKNIIGNFENGQQKGLKVQCSGIDQLPQNKDLFYLHY